LLIEYPHSGIGLVFLLTVQTNCRGAPYMSYVYVTIEEKRIVCVQKNFSVKMRRFSVCVLRVVSGSVRWFWLCLLVFLRTFNVVKRDV